MPLPAPVSDVSPSPRRTVLLLLVVAAVLCGWILSLPLFPTQDGPMHLYFVRIVQALLFGQDPGIFARFYTIKHVLPPYSLYYYALIALNHLCSLVRADQLIICAYIVSFLFGFRYLAISLGRLGNTTALLAAPLVLNWPLGMGFVNFCLSLSFALWALGLWCRVAQSPPGGRNAARLAGFVALCFVMLLTHPVPLLVTLAFAAAELVLRFLAIRRGAPLSLRASVLAFLAAASSVGYLLLFKGAHSMVQHHDYTSYPAMVRGNAKNFYLLRTLTCFAGHSLNDTLYKAAFLLLPVLAVVLFFTGRRHGSTDYRQTLAALWTALGLALAVLLPLLPPDLNNSHLFTARLVILVWLALLVGASATGPRRLPALALPAVGLLLTAWTLGIAVARIDPIARDLARQESAPTGLDRNVVLFLHSEDYFKNDRLSYDPYYWSPVRLLRRSGSVMLNTPWLDLQIIPVGAVQATMPTGRIDSYALESPPDLRPDLQASAPDRALLATQLNATLVNDGPDRPGNTLSSPSGDAMLPLLSGNWRQWQCTPHPFAEVCLPPSR